MRSKLPTHLPPVLHQLHTQWEEDRTEIVKTICDDENVLFCWTLASMDLDEEDKKGLLKHIIQLWLTTINHSLGNIQ